jgi:hypothetical protein
MTKTRMRLGVSKNSRCGGPEPGDPGGLQVKFILLTKGVAGVIACFAETPKLCEVLQAGAMAGTWSWRQMQKHRGCLVVDKGAGEGASMTASKTRGEKPRFKASW